MKLVCPNCGAQYAVDDSMIPPNGRDVQCSNCSHTWFQVPPEQDYELAEELGYDLPEPEPEVEEWPDEIPTATQQDLPDPASATLAADRPPVPQRRARDDRVFNVLREEAARETAAREREARAALETQPELDISQPEPRPTEIPVTDLPSRDGATSQLLDHSEEAQIAAAATLAGKSAARRDLLPDIEEINSSLRPGETAAEAEAADTLQSSQYAQRRKKNGFRTGFTAVVICAVLALALYLHAPKVAQVLAFTETPLQKYVATIDGLRLWLDRSLMAAVDASVPDGE